MNRLGNLRQHFWKTLRMSKALGVDLSEEMATGRLSQKGYAELVQTCRGCAWSEGCEDWLAAQNGARAPVPGGCANQPAWAALRGETAKQG